MSDEWDAGECSKQWARLMLLSVPQQHAAYEDSLLDAKRKAREDGRREIERRKAEIADENRRKFDELTEQMDSRHLALHGKVLQGTVKPFHYFKAQNPST